MGDGLVQPPRPRACRALKVKPAPELCRYKKWQQRHILIWGRSLLIAFCGRDGPQMARKRR